MGSSTMLCLTDINLLKDRANVLLHGYGTVTVWAPGTRLLPESEMWDYVQLCPS